MLLITKFFFKIRKGKKIQGANPSADVVSYLLVFKSMVGSWIPIPHPDSVDNIVVTARYNASLYPPPSGLLGLAYPTPNLGVALAAPSPQVHDQALSAPAISDQNLNAGLITTPKPSLSFYLQAPPVNSNLKKEKKFKPSYKDVTLFYPVFTSSKKTPKASTTSNGINVCPSGNTTNAEESASIFIL